MIVDTREDLITRIAWLYYKQKLTQERIAERVGVSRPKVQRLLERARDLEIIQFTVKHPFANLLSLEDALKREYGLADAMVVPSDDSNEEELRRSFAKAGASYLERKLGAAERCTLGLGWGNTTAFLADYFEPNAVNARVEVVSLIGNLMMNVVMNPYLTGEKIAGKLKAPFYNIWAPAIAQTRAHAEVFKSEPWINEVLAIARKADLLLVSIGEVSPSATLFTMGYMNARDLKRIMRKGAVGDILSRFFDAEGRIIDDEVHDRVIGVPLEAFSEPGKTAVAVAGGPSKVEAIRGALRGGFFKVLITDERTARSLITPPVKARKGERA